MDPLACNFDINHLYDDHFCSYPQIGYDCEGNISEYVLGMEAEGGIVFYIDESGQHGLVAATEDIGPFAWGCQEINISNANEQLIGTGLQNKLLEAMAMEKACITTPLANNALQAPESTILVGETSQELAQHCIHLLLIQLQSHDANT